MISLFYNAPEAWLEEQFKHFHRHPELSAQEYETTARLKSILTAAGIEIMDLPLETGLVAVIGSGDGPTVALRSDIDALPIQEETMLEYASERDLCMHACGHDFHTTAVLGAALYLKKREADLKGRVKLIFQAAEEINRGAMQVLESTALDDVSMIFGIHSSPALENGSLGIRSGAVTAAVDRFAIKITGRGGHAAMPNQSLDPITTAAALVMNAQTIVSRRISPFHSAVLSFTHIEAGQTWNIIPESAFLEGTVRTHDPEDRKNIKDRLYEMTKLTASAQGLTGEFNWEAGPPAVINEEEAASFAAAIAKKSGFRVRDPEDSMIGEDFAYYLERIPGCFIMVGTGLSYALHNPKFKVDPKALRPTASYLAELAESWLARI